MPSHGWVLTCGVLCGHGSPVECGTVAGDGPHLVNGPDGNGLEGLVGAHVQPGRALRDVRVDKKGTGVTQVTLT